MDNDKKNNDESLEADKVSLPPIDPLTNPKEVQKEIEKLMKSKFGDKVKVVTSQVKEDFSDLDSLDDLDFLDGDLDIEDESKVDSKDNPIQFEFNYLPREVKDFLDQYIVKQDEAKRALAIAVCDHYNYVKKCQSQIENGESVEEDNYSKQNVLMLGPTGVGKTYLIKTLAKLIGVPFIKADATRFTEAGYAGANVDDLVKDLLSVAKDNISLAQYGIIFIDEVDKIAGNSTTTGAKDISGRGVQNSLLKLMEDTEIDLMSPTDMLSQMQALMDFQRKGKVSKKIIHTKHILFIVSGAFAGLEDITAKRLRVNTIGLKELKESKDNDSDLDLLRYVTTKDLISFGFEPEFIGRLPVRLTCSYLSVEDLFLILKESKGSILNQYIDSFKAYGINIEFSNEGLRRIAELAYEEKTGARALMTVMEKIFRDFKFELPSTSIKHIIVTKELVDNPSTVLKKVLEYEKK